MKVKKPVKVVLVVVCLFLAFVVSALIFAKLYFTDERVKGLVVPALEEAFGRKVYVSSASFGVFSGFSLKGLVVKEKDGAGDFLRVRSFTLKPNPLSLLKGRLSIVKVVLVEPFVFLVRDRRGIFNFQTLPFLERRGGRGFYPISVSRLEVDDGRLVFRDFKGELPSANILVDAGVGLSLGGDFVSLSGEVVLDADFSLKRFKGEARGSFRFRGRDLLYKAVLSASGQDIKVSGVVHDYALNPKVFLRISSGSLELDKLSGLACFSGGSFVLVPVDGEIELGEVNYKGFKASRVKGRFSVRDNIFSLEGLEGKLSGGSFLIKLKASLEKAPFPLSGDVRLVGVSLAKLFNPPLVEGLLSASATFSSVGSTWKVFSRHVNAQGSFRVERFGLSGLPLVRSLGRFIDLGALERLSFREVKGDFKVRGGKLFVKGDFKGEKLSAHISGYVGLDGSLRLPVILRLSPELSRFSHLKYISGMGKSLKLPLLIKGTLKRPILVPHIF